MTAVVRARGLTTRPGRATALRSVDLDVAAGECVGLLGPYHGGRTTLLRVLATLVRPSAGTLDIAGIDAIRHVYAARARVAYVGHDPLAAYGLRVREHLEFVHAARIRHSEPATRSAVQDVIERAGLLPDASVDELSTGFRQRLSLAAACLVAPQVLLLDDPFRTIDTESRTHVVSWLREVRDSGTTVLASLSEEQDVDALCHRVVRAEGEA
jgi:ABC-type multidrug transport system ATPase subunit